MRAQFEKGDHVAWQLDTGYYANGVVQSASTHWVTIKPFGTKPVVIIRSTRVLPD